MRPSQETAGIQSSGGSLEAGRLVLQDEVDRWIPEALLTSSQHRHGSGEREAGLGPTLACREPLNVIRLQTGSYIKQWSGGWVCAGSYTQRPGVGKQQHHSHFQLCSKGNCVGMNSQKGLPLQRGLLET